MYVSCVLPLMAPGDQPDRPEDRPEDRSRTGERVTTHARWRYVENKEFKEGSCIGQVDLLKTYKDRKPESRRKCQLSGMPHDWNTL